MARTDRPTDSSSRGSTAGWEDLFERSEQAAQSRVGTQRRRDRPPRRRPLRLLRRQPRPPDAALRTGPAGVLADLAPRLGLAHTASGRGVLTVPLFSHHTDIVCANDRGPNLVFRNRGDGTFDECSAEIGLADADEHGHAVTSLDAGGGQLGLCWGNREGPHRLMVRGEDGSWRDRATAGLAFPCAVWTVIAADFDNDGHDELFFNNLGEPNRLFRLTASPDAEGEVAPCSILAMPATRTASGQGQQCAISTATACSNC